MKSVGLVVVVVIALAAVPTGQALKTEITGFSGYTLGADMKQVLSTHPNLRPSTDAFTNSAPVATEYRTTVEVPDMQPADMTLTFQKGKLARILLGWSAAKFGSVKVWEHDAGVLATIPAAFSPQLLKLNRTFIGGDFAIRLEDANGNQLAIFGFRPNLSFSVGYLWAQYVKPPASKP